MKRTLYGTLAILLVLTALLSGAVVASSQPLPPPPRPPENPSPSNSENLVIILRDLVTSQPVPNASVRVRNITTLDTYFHRTDTQGRTTFYYLYAGSWRVDISENRYQSATYYVLMVEGLGTKTWTISLVPK